MSLVRAHRFTCSRIVRCACLSSLNRGIHQATTFSWPPPTGAYVHLPFCKKKCLYCDFPVVAVGMGKDQRQHDSMSAYVDALLLEIEASEAINTQGPLESLFFGGGTPSLISLHLLETIIAAIDKRFGIATGAEISIEADPGTFDRGTLMSYRNLGIQRLSMGVQSFNKDLLVTCGRSHTVSDVYRAIEDVYAADMPSWSLDLMSGLPHLTPDLWQKTLDATLDADPHHISVYDLQIEEKTPFHKLYTYGRAPLPNEHHAAAMYAMAVSALSDKEVYEHYEVSNYAKEGHRCRHNMSYWLGKSFYGFGMGATSYLCGRRWARPRTMKAYMDWTKRFVGDGTSRKVAGMMEKDVAEDSEEDQLLDCVMLRLRLADGLDLAELERRFGRDACALVLKGLTPHIEAGRALFRDYEKTCVRLSDPDGFLLSNDIISDIFSLISS